jgi:hypothetical protein
VVAKGCTVGFGVFKSGNGECLAQCTSAFLPLYSSAPRCFDCLLTDLLSYNSKSAVKTRCETDPRDPYNFDGQTPSMILSRYPLANTDAFILPSWAYRRAVLYAQLQLEEGTTLDYYCVQLISASISTVVPYAGYYANGATTSDDAYRQEQLLQAQKVVAWVKQKSGSRPAIIAGDWHATPRTGQSNYEIYDYLRMNLTEAALPKETLPCTLCPTPQNKFNGANDDYAWLDTYLSRFPDQATTETSVFLDDPNLVMLPDGTRGPISPVFGWNVRVVRPQ